MSSHDIEDIYPLTPMQSGMLFHALRDAEAGPYFQQFLWTLQGTLDVSALERAWQQVVDRHAVLRTDFDWEELDEPVQIVNRRVPVSVAQEDWRKLTPTDQRKSLEEFLLVDRRRGVDLASAPLMRVTVIRMAQDVHQLIWSHHHLLLDGWSWPLVFKEVWRYYDGSVLDEELDLPQPRPYRDYIAWLQAQDRTDAEVYWRQELKGFTSPTTLAPASAVSQRAGASGECEEQWLRLSRSLTDAVKAFAREHHLTVGIVVQAAWAVLLSRYSAERDVVFGATVAGRPASFQGVESMVGVFINTLPVRVQVPDDFPIVSWLKQLYGGNAERTQYEHCSLIDIRGWTEAPHGVPLFESILAFENFPGGGADFSSATGLVVRDLRMIERTGYPLTVAVRGGRELAILFVYDRSYFEAASINRLAKHYEHLIRDLVANPGGTVGGLDMLAGDERRQLLAEWNDTRTDYPREATIHELFEGQSKQKSAAEAVSFEGRTLTYEELNRRANQLAHYLKRYGVGPEVMVGIAAERSLELVVGMLGILKAGGAYVPLDAAYPKLRLEFMLADTDTPVLLTQSGLREHLPETSARVVCLDTDWEAIAKESEANPGVEVSARNLAYVMYTSGSTGRPKGICIEHRSVVRLVRDTNYLKFGPEARIIQASNASFDAATFEVWGALLNGGCLVGVAREVTLDPGALARFLYEQAISVMFITTALFNQVAREAPRAFSGLDTLLFGGEAVDPNSVRDVLEHGRPAHLMHVYGPTESTTFASFHEVKEVAEGSATVPIGHGLANTTLYLLDGRMEPVPVGVTGELYIGGDGLARGYLNRPAMTEEKFVADPFDASGGGRLYRTGDRARYLADGSIEFLGRIDHQVKIRGHRIELGEIEAALGEDPRVKDTVVLCRENAPGEKHLVAYAVPTSGSVSAADDLVPSLRAHVQARLPEYMVPAAFVLLDALPLTPNGKVDRQALPAPEQLRACLGGEYAAPRTEVEARLADIWAEVLQLDRVGIHDNFFELGGHSLIATRVINRVRDSFGVELPLMQIFERRTLAELASFVGALRWVAGGGGDRDNLADERDEIEL